MSKWATDYLGKLSPESYNRFIALQKNLGQLERNEELRGALLDFIADFANWDNSNVREFVETSRALTQAAHEAFGGAAGTRPLVVDPFAGGGSIPLETLRVGGDAFASDLNPVAVLLNKVVLEYVPRYGERLAEEVRKWGEWMAREAKNKLAVFYPGDPDGATPIAYLWARVIQCEGPGCGVEVPLLRSLLLAKKSNRAVALQLVPNKADNCVDFQLIAKERDGWVNQDDPNGKIDRPSFEGTVKRGSATCPCCGYTTPVARVREQLRLRGGGTTDGRMTAVVVGRDDRQGRFYRLPTEQDLEVARLAASELKRNEASHVGVLSVVPNEKLDTRGIRHTWAMLYGLDSWSAYFTHRQALALSTLVRLVTIAGTQIKSEDSEFVRAVQSCLAIVVDRQADRASSICRWDAPYQKISNTFGRQALPITWDFAEVNIFSGATGDLEGALSWVCEVIEANTILPARGTVVQSSATNHPLPADAAAAMITDPPYYDAVPYAFLSDFFYVWLHRSLVKVHPDLFAQTAVPKDGEIVVDRPHELSNSTHDIAFYERELTKAFAEGRRVVHPDGIGTIVFASKTTASWEAVLKAVIDAGWIITGSWPIDTEMENRVSAQGQARLASSVHLVCRPRENSDGSVRTDAVGDWRDVLQELPRRIHEWMPRLAQEGVVGADAIFACLGPALEIFSRYSRVEKANGDAVGLKEFLEQVWAAVAKEALAMIFTEADTTGFEEDARLTAMWLWTLSAGSSDSDGELSNEVENDEEPDEPSSKSKATGFVLEYDAARKIAQGLGAHLEDMGTLVEVKGEIARLLPVAERATALFGREEATPIADAKKTTRQSDLLEVLETLDESGSARANYLQRPGETVLDRIHQSMILFGTGRSEALKRFLVEEGVGRDGRFWSLAQALSALYPNSTNEKRWIDGVLARKKGLGF
jgi:adenine-specific DNA methylase